MVLGAMLQLKHTPPLQSTTPGLHPVSIHQIAPPLRGSKHPITDYYSVYRARKDEKLSRPGWLVTYRNKVPPPGVEPVHVTHLSTNRARRRVTSLIRPALLPLRHAATEVWFQQFSERCRISHDRNVVGNWVRGGRTCTRERTLAKRRRDMVKATKDEPSVRQLLHSGRAVVRHIARTQCIRRGLLLLLTE